MPGNESKTCDCCQTPYEYLVQDDERQRQKANEKYCADCVRVFADSLVLIRPNYERHPRIDMFKEAEAAMIKRLLQQPEFKGVIGLKAITATHVSNIRFDQKRVLAAFAARQRQEEVSAVLLAQFSGASRSEDYSLLPLDFHACRRIILDSNAYQSGFMPMSIAARFVASVNYLNRHYPACSEGLGMIVNAYIQALYNQSHFVEAVSVFLQYYGNVTVFQKGGALYDFHGLNEASAFIATILVALAEAQGESVRFIVGRQGAAVREGVRQVVNLFKLQQKETGNPGVLQVSGAKQLFALYVHYMFNDHNLFLQKLYHPLFEVHELGFRARIENDQKNQLDKLLHQAEQEKLLLVEAGERASLVSRHLNGLWFILACQQKHRMSLEERVERQPLQVAHQRLRDKRSLEVLETQLLGDYGQKYNREMQTMYRAQYFFLQKLAMLSQEIDARNILVGGWAADQAEAVGRFYQSERDSFLDKEKAHRKNLMRDYSQKSKSILDLRLSLFSKLKDELYGQFEAIDFFEKRNLFERHLIMSEEDQARLRLDPCGQYVSVCIDMVKAFRQLLVSFVELAGNNVFVSGSNAGVTDFLGVEAGTARRVRRQKGGMFVTGMQIQLAADMLIANLEALVDAMLVYSNFTKTHMHDEEQVCFVLMHTVACCYQQLMRNPEIFNLLSRSSRDQVKALEARCILSGDKGPFEELNLIFARNLLKDLPAHLHCRNINNANFIVVTGNGMAREVLSRRSLSYLFEELAEELWVLSSRSTEYLSMKRGDFVADVAQLSTAIVYGYTTELLTLIEEAHCVEDMLRGQSFVAQ